MPSGSSAAPAERRDAVAAAARKLGVRNVAIWSGTEFEEQLRLRAEFLLRRLVEGAAFPDSEAELRRFADDFPNLDDDEALAMIAAVFDRPAFRTRFREESSLPAFLRAIEDTIGALNTGIWRTRDGVEIRRLPSIHNIRNGAIRVELARVSRGLDDLRRFFKRRLADGTIRHCSCGQADCPVFTIEPRTATELNRVRTRVLDRFHRLVPAFAMRVD